MDIVKREYFSYVVMRDSEGGKVKLPERQHQALYSILFSLSFFSSECLTEMICSSPFEFHDLVVCFLRLE